MLRFLTDGLQDTEDQGDRGMSLLKHNFCITVKDLALSLDPWSCYERLEWWEGSPGSFGETSESV
jgi:hypothetical protein